LLKSKKLQVTKYTLSHLPFQGDEISAIAITKDGKYIISGTSLGHISIYERESKKLVHKLEDSNGGISFILIHVSMIFS